MSTNKLNYLSEEELIHQAIEALHNAIGPIETARFLALRRTPRLESVLRHQVWQDGLDKDAFFDQVFDIQQVSETAALH